MGKPVAALTYLDPIRDGWGGLIARFRRQYGLDVRECLRTMPWQDFIFHVDDLAPTWTNADENLATLLDLQNYWLESEYAKWTTTPEEAKALERASRGRTVPPMPIIRPVAYRPPAAHAAAVERYEQLRDLYADDGVEVAAPDPGQMDARALFSFLGNPR